MAGIYIHIPFCKSRCYYCDFHSSTILSDIPDLVKSIKKEIILERDFLKDEPIETIYFGGGTPSVLNIKDINEINKIIADYYTIVPNPEITLECNPDDLQPEYICELAGSGINRLSIGVQSFINKHLKIMNRRHSAGQSTKAVNNSKQHGFNNISIDLIYGLPTMTNDEWKLNLDKAMELNIQHISAYHLTIEKGTVFSRYQQKGIINEIDEDTSDKQFRQLVQVTTEAGFEHYEISNFAINKYYSRHNSNYWKQVPYLGIGPSAHSYNLKSRYWNISHNRKYIESIITGKAIREVETLDSIIRYNEYLMTSLRTKWGIDLQYVEKEFGAEKATLLNDRLLVFINQGIAFKYGSTIRLTSEGFFISDKIISDLFVH